MNWKAVLAVVIVLAIVGFLFVTQMGIDITSKLGLGSLTSFFVKQTPSTTFSFTMTTNRQSFFGQDYKVVNASIDTTGIYSYLQAGNLYLENKEGKKITVALRNFNGDFQITAGGSIALKGTATYAEFGQIAASADKTINIQLEIIPSTYTLSSLQQNSISFDSISGTLQRGAPGNPDTVNFSNSKLSISYFTGALSQGADGTTILQGTASSIKGDTFSFA